MFMLCRQQMVSLIYGRAGFQLPAAGMLCCRQQSSAYTAIESSKHMQKLLTKKGAKTKRKWYQPHIGEPLELSGKRQRPTKRGVSEAQGHRARQLGHVLYARICQIVNSGELSEELLGKHVLFTRVKMHPTFSGINVYWDANRSDAAEIETLLHSMGGKLRSLLISYHVLGRIPSITFVKDRSRGSLSELNQLFEVADYGPDYVPSSSTDGEDSRITLGNDNSRGTRWEVEKDSLTEGLSALNLQENLGLQASKASENCSDDRLGKLSAEAGWQSEPHPQLQARDTSSEASSALRDPSGFRSDLYGLPRDDLMKKIMAQKKKVRHQDASGGEDLTRSLARFEDFSKLKSKSKEKEKMVRERDSTKVKQRLLEQEFDEIQYSLQQADDGYDIEKEYDDGIDVEYDNDWNEKR